jgi:hypothetical protein
MACVDRAALPEGDCEVTTSRRRSVERMPGRNAPLGPDLGERQTRVEVTDLG